MHIYDLALPIGSLLMELIHVDLSSALPGSWLPLCSPIISYFKVFSLAQLLFCIFSYIPQMGMSEWLSLRISASPEIYFLYFPRWQVPCLGCILTTVLFSQGSMKISSFYLLGFQTNPNASLVFWLQKLLTLYGGLKELPYLP